MSCNREQSSSPDYCNEKQPFHEPSLALFQQMLTAIIRAMRTISRLFVCMILLASSLAQTHKAITNTPHANVYPIQEGFVDANGVLIYYTIVGKGEPLMVVHGGAGA